MPDTDIAQQMPQSIGLRELAILLVKHLGHHSGRFQISVSFRVGVGQVQIGDPMPGVMVGIEGVALVPVPDTAEGVTVVDAAEVNPAPKRKRKRPLEADAS